jgi:hypothetical protein
MPIPAAEHAFLFRGRGLAYAALRGAVTACALLLGIAGADDVTVVEPSPPAIAEPRPDRHPNLKRLSPAEDVWIDPQKKVVVVGGAIALDRGMIEVFACPKGSKEHEAIVATDSSAKLVHAGLLAIGLEPGNPVSFDPVYVPAKGQVVAITMRWKDAAGKTRTAPMTTAAPPFWRRRSSAIA